MPPLQTREAHVKTSFIISLFIVETRWNIGKCWLGAKYGRGQVAKVFGLFGLPGFEFGGLLSFQWWELPTKYFDGARNHVSGMKIYTWHLEDKTHDCGFFLICQKVPSATLFSSRSVLARADGHISLSPIKNNLLFSLYCLGKIRFLSACASFPLPTM